MEGHTLRLAVSFVKAAGWRKLITLLALTAVFMTTFVGYAAAYATERNALDWYLGTAFPDYSLSPKVEPFQSPPLYTTASDLANLSREAVNVSSALMAIPWVMSAGPFLQLNFVSFVRPSYNAPSPGALNFVTAAVFKAQQANYVDRIVAGTDDLGPGGVLVPENVARGESLTVGQTLPLYSNSFFSPANCTGSCSLEPGYANVTVQGIYAPKAGPASFDNNVFPWTFSDYVIPVILNLSELPALLPTTVPSNSYPWQQIRYDVLVARGAVLDPLDTAGNTRRLAALKTQMFFVAQKHGLQVYSSLEYAYSHFLQDRSYLDLTVLFAVAPVILVAVVLGVMMETAEAYVRYRDLSIARSRGVGLRRLRRVLWLEALVEAAIASLLGLGGGAVAALLLWPNAGAVLAAGAATAALISFTLCLGIALAMKALTVRGFSKRTIAEGLVRRDEVTAGKEFTGRVALLAVGVGVTLLAVSWFSTTPMLNVLQASVLLFGTMRDWLLSLSFLALLVAVCLYTPRMTNRLARGRSKAAGARHAPSLYRSTLVRSKRSPDPVVLLVAALVLSASVFTAGLVALQRASVENTIYSETGSDIFLWLPGNPFGGPAGAFNPPITAYLAVPGVANLTFASGTPSSSGISVFLVNTSGYLDTVRTDKLAYGGTLRDALRDFTNPGAAVVTDAFVQATGLGVGSTFGNLTVTGVVPRMPGLQDSDQLGSPALFTDYLNYGLSPSQTDIRRVLVRVDPSADPSAVAAQLSSLDQLALARNAAEEVAGLVSSPLLGALGSLWTVGLATFGFLILVALGGYAVRIRVELENDFARMRARGLPGRLIPGLLLRPVLLTVLGSILWGVGLGELILFFMAEATSAAGSAPLSVLLPSPSLVLLIVAYAVLGMLLALALARGFERLPLGPRLRERIV